MLRELFISAIMAALVIFPMFGLRLGGDDGVQNITMVWPTAMIIFLSAMALRVAALWWGTQHKKLPALKVNFKLQETWSVWAGRGLIALAIILPFLPFMDRRLLDVATLILTYVAMGWGLSIMVGMLGLLDLGYVAFYAIGAYAFALLAVDHAWSFWQTLPVVIAACGAGAMLIGGPILRLRGDYFAIVSLGFAETVRLTLINWQSLTHGPDGVTGVPRPSVFGAATFNMGDTALPQFSDLLGIAHDPMHRLIFIYF
jgi:ABC-type branched-subunit amino acid transport system permease subunit